MTSFYMAVLFAKCTCVCACNKFYMTSFWFSDRHAYDSYNYFPLQQYIADQLHASSQITLTRFLC